MLLSYMFFFFKQKTAYEMRISDWSSDVCSSDLNTQSSKGIGVGGIFRRLEAHLHVALGSQVINFVRLRLLDQADQIGGIRHVAIEQAELGIVDKIGRAHV